MLYLEKTITISIVLACLLVNLSEATDDDVKHDHIIIYVPYYIKTIKHTHTITKHIHHKEKEKEQYKVLGYTVGKPVPAPHHAMSAEDNNSNDYHGNFGQSGENNKEDIFKTHTGYLNGATHYAGHDQANHIDLTDNFSGY